MALDRIHILIPIHMCQYIFHWFHRWYLLSARYPTGWGVNYFHVGILYSMWSSSPHIRILQLLLSLKWIRIFGGRAGALQLTSAIGWLANHDYWQKVVPANKPWPMIIEGEESMARRDHAHLGAVPAGFLKSRPYIPVHNRGDAIFVIGAYTPPADMTGVDNLCAIWASCPETNCSCSVTSISTWETHTQSRRRSLPIFSTTLM